MKDIFLFIFIWLQICNVLLRFSYLGWSEYPRKVEWTRGKDATVFILEFAFLVWALFVVFDHAP